MHGYNCACMATNYVHWYICYLATNVFEEGSCGFQSIILWDFCIHCSNAEAQSYLATNSFKRFVFSLVL